MMPCFVPFATRSRQDVCVCSAIGDRLPLDLCFSLANGMRLRPASTPTGLGSECLRRRLYTAGLPHLSKTNLLQPIGD